MDPQEGQHHSIEEVEKALQGLPDDYWLELSEWARWKLDNNSVAGGDDVIADVYELFVAAGTRHWPHGVAIQTCFKNAVRSAINGAWEKHDRKRAKQHAPTGDDGEPVDPLENVLDSIEGRPMEVLATPSVLRELTEREKQERAQAIVEHIEKHFADDEVVTAILIGLEAGMPARQVQDTFNLSETEYDSARKKLRRFINKHYPDGWLAYEQRRQEPESSS